MANELSHNQSQVAQYVHDVAEMETAVYTLGCAIGDCKEKRNLLKNEAQAAMVTARTKVERSQSKYNALQIQKIKLTNERIPPVAYMNGTADLPQFLLSVLMLLSFAIAVLLAFFGIQLTMWLLLPIPLCLLAIGLSFKRLWKLGVEGSQKAKAIHDQALAETNAELEKVEKKLAERRIAYDQSVIFRDKMEAAANVVEAQRTLLKRANEQIRANLDRYYDLNLIRGKYRYIECALIMDEALEKGKVNSVEAAMMLCESALFANPDLKHSYAANLGKMKVAPDWIIAKRDAIQKFVSNSNDEISDLSWQAADSNLPFADNDLLVKNTAISRYADEQVRASAAYLCRLN